MEVSRKKGRKMRNKHNKSTIKEEEKRRGFREENQISFFDVVPPVGQEERESRRRGRKRGR